MKEITPYKTLHEMQKALDNGGRFYNFFTEAGDNVVSSAELAKAAGVFSNEVSAFLFFEMAQQELAPTDRRAIQSLLDQELRRRYQEQHPTTLKPSEVESNGTAGQAIIVSGYPRFVEDKTAFTGFIMIPMQSGTTSTFIMVPLFDRFDVYEVFDDREMSLPNSMVATVRGMKLSCDHSIRFGGVLKELKFKDETKKSHKFYLEVAYYTRLCQVHNQ